MFNSNTYLKVEFMPDGRPVFTANLNKKTDPEHVSNFINSFITREYLQEWLENIYNICEKKNIKDIGLEICESVMEIQGEIEVRPVRRGRNPIIKASQVMNQYVGDDNA